MKFIGDFHIHSHYSRATSKTLNPENLDYWAAVKGIKVVGTGDFTHPGWLSELKEKLKSAEPGLYSLKEEYKLKDKDHHSGDTRFILTAEISTIYKARPSRTSRTARTTEKAQEKTRKVHHLIFAPDFKAVERIQQMLTRIGANITSDGRPILGLDSRDLLEITLESSEKTFFVPAHIWTPWFSVLGSKSGFDSIDECFKDLKEHICAAETGLSSDPPMNWMCSFLDKYTLISNSDAHSPEKLGREANLFDTGLSYHNIIEAIKTGNPDQFLGTIEFFPQEGKYHFDGHRNCGICWDPLQTLKNGSICPVCGKPVTVGVLNRVAQLADREDITLRPKRLPYYSLIPLKEILAEIFCCGSAAKKVEQAYQSLIKKAGSEFNILLNLPLSELERMGDALLSEAIKRMRNREVIVQEGYDGEFGRIHVFQDNEKDPEDNLLFKELATVKKPARRSQVEFDLARYQDLKKQTAHTDEQKPFEGKKLKLNYGLFSDLNEEQKRAVCHESGLAYPAARPAAGKTRQATRPGIPVHSASPSASTTKQDARQANQAAFPVYPACPASAVLIIAGPGTGKTRVLTYRIAYLISKKGITPEKILAITFTNKAAGEIADRLNHLIKDTSKLDCLHTHTFHSFGLSILKEHYKETGRDDSFIILDEEHKLRLLKKILRIKNPESISEQISKKKQQPELQELIMSNQNSEYGENGDETKQALHLYQKALKENNAFDLDDLIYLPVLLFKDHPEILTSYQRRFTHILIDEYQDINQAQYTLIRMLMQPESSELFAIGDPNQAIYGFRGADIKYINQFKEDFKQVTIYNLKTSYRCSERILTASSQILRGSHPALQGLSEGINIRIVENPTHRSEAEFVARQIEKMIGGLHFFSLDSRISSGDRESRIESLADFAVLCRLREQMTPIEKAFTDHNIPCQKVMEKSLYRTEPVRSVLDILYALYYPEGMMLLDKIKGVEIEEFLKMERQSLLKKQIKQAIQIIADYFIEQKDNSKIRALNEVLLTAESYGSDYSGFFRHISLRKGMDDYKKEMEGISLLTLHASKGLEFQVVFITGCEEGLIPYRLFENTRTDLEEERRLFYVGMTRARRFLYLSTAKKRYLFGREYNLTKSPFLKDIKRELKEKIIGEYKIKEEPRQLSLF
jgi:DNA helicase-2/ATP-dependent DNA helicase PcrA